MSAANCMTATSNMNSAGAAQIHTDLIESKFNQLAKKLFDELKQSDCSRDFFQAIDVILNENDDPNGQSKHHNHSSSGSKAATRQSSNLKTTRQQERTNNATKRLKERNNEPTTATNDDDDTRLTKKDISETRNQFDQLRKQCELIREKQRQQQEQLDNHQQILFDTQYRSLPIEITETVASQEQRRTNARSPQKTPSSQGTELTRVSSRSQVIQKAAADLAQDNGVASLATTTSKQQNNVAAAANKKQPSTSGATSRPNGIKTSLSKENLANVSKRDSSATLSAKPAADQQRQRSAIPQSTILSGISQKVDGATYPISKSATVGSSSLASSATGRNTRSNLTGSGGGSDSDMLGQTLKRQSSLRLNNKQSRETQQEVIQKQTRTLAGSEKLRQRRPTKATLLDYRALATDESNDDLDDDDDDDDSEDDANDYLNLASRRANFNQKFISRGRQEAAAESNESAVVNSGHQTGGRQQVTSTIQSGITAKQTPLNTSNMTVAKQKQRFSSGAQLVRSSTIGASQMASSRHRQQIGAKPGVVAKHDDELAQADDGQEPHEPRSLGGLLTSHDIGQLYKPHMNYSTSLLGNHRLSDDDEIIIIPTCQSPSLLSASVSPVGGGSQRQQQQQTLAQQQQHDRASAASNNVDELSERFSISRTKSFWEKLANSKGAAGVGGELDAKCNASNGPSPQHGKHYLNSSQRSLSSGPNLVADTKSSQCSLLNQSAGSGGHNTSGQSSNGGQHYPAAMKRAFDRMDSTGGSGNSHYSGGSSSSSSSSDEQTVPSNLSLAERRAMLVSAAAGATKPHSNSNNNHHRQAHLRSPTTTNASMNPTINQLVQQDQINRSDRFRQTR